MTNGCDDMFWNSLDLGKFWKGFDNLVNSTGNPGLKLSHVRFVHQKWFVHI